MSTKKPKSKLTTLEQKFLELFVKHQPLKMILVVILLVVASIEIFLNYSSSIGITTSVLYLLTLAILVVLIPWERLTLFKAAGIELGLEKPLETAIRSLEEAKGEYSNDENIRNLLPRLRNQIEQSKGGRVLWIDDTPKNIFSERRLLRALGIETIVANSSKEAWGYLEIDGDFDLIISDMRNGNESNPDQSKNPGAVDFIKIIRESDADQENSGRYSHIPSIPIIVYSGKTNRHLLKDMDSIPNEYVLQAPLILCGRVKIEYFFEKLITTLAESRSNPIEIRRGPSERLNKSKF